MARPLVATKLSAPRLPPSLVSRPRLLERVLRAEESRLTLVSAPAGFGKTTLLLEWLRRPLSAHRSVAWLSLDAADDDFVSFWTYVVTALHTAVPEVGRHSLELLDTSPVPADLVLTTVLNDLAEAPTPVWLVLDDYHVVANREIGEAMSYLLEHLPPHVHVVLSTRADPELPLSRWRVRGDLVEIRAADLRFTSAEAAQYLDAATGLNLSAQDVEALEERTEGWIAALQLAALSLRGRDDVSGYIAAFAGNDRFVLDYLVEEVLARQPEPVRGFLLTSAVLDRLTGSLCDALTGRDDGNDTLVALERANLFLVPLDDRREWYRYHHLFADVLRSRMRAEQPAQIPLLHQRASRWYEAQDLPEDAVRHALAGREFDRAAYLVEAAVPMARRNRQDAMLAGWLKALPDEEVRRSPVLSVFYGSMLMVSGDLDGLEGRLDDAERALAGGAGIPLRSWPEPDELHALPATIAIHRASLAQARGDVAGTARHARRALELSGPDDHLSRGGAAGFLGLAQWAQGEISTAVETFAGAVASLHAAGNLVDELTSTVPLADMWLAAGRPSEARRLYQRGLEQGESQNVAAPFAIGDLHVGLSEIDCEANDTGAARRHLLVAEDLAPAGASGGRWRWFLAMGRLAYAEGDGDAAIDHVNQAELRYHRGFFPDVRPIAAMRARVWVTQGRLADAAGWAHARGVSAQDEADYLREFDHLTLVRLVIAQHRARPDTDALGQAEGLLDRLLAAAQASGRAGSMVEIGMLRALAYEARGHWPRAREVLALTLAKAPEPDGYVRLFLDEGGPMIRMLRDATRHGIGGERVHRLLDHQADGNGRAGGAGQLPPSLRTASLSERELHVLRMLGSELSGPEIALELFVSHNTLRTHTKHIFSKLEVTTRRAAVARARERGLL